MVSHCWATPFADVLSIIKRCDENTNKSNLFFFDIFSMNQHDFADLSRSSSTGMQDPSHVYEVMLEALTNSIQVPNRVLLALTPHDRPLLLSRSWCLYEIYTAWKVGAEVLCGFVPEAEQKVINSLVQDDGLVDRMLATVDAEKSQATVESDRVMILGLIKKAGVENFNQFVRKKLSASLRVVALTSVPKSVHEDGPDLFASMPSRSISTATRSVFIRQTSEQTSQEFQSAVHVDFSNSCLQVDDIEDVNIIFRV